MARYVTALAIAGSDSSGGAGIQADLKTMSALGVYAATAITAVTAQGADGVVALHPVPPDVVAAQIRAAMQFIRPQAVKIGMLCNAGVAEAVADALLPHPDVPLVIDPVLAASDGTPLLGTEAVALLKRRLLPRATLLTPNLPEAALLSGLKILSPHQISPAATQLLQGGCRAVLVKGGHADDPATVCDRLYMRDGSCHRFASQRIATANSHGTGCTLSSAIAALLACGCTLAEACRRGHGFVADALRAGADVEFASAGSGPLNHLFNPQPLKKRTE